MCSNSPLASNYGLVPKRTSGGTWLSMAWEIRGDWRSNLTCLNYRRCEIFNTHDVKINVVDYYK